MNNDDFFFNNNDINDFIDDVICNAEQIPCYAYDFNGSFGDFDNFSSHLYNIGCSYYNLINI